MDKPTNRREAELEDAVRSFMSITTDLAQAVKDLSGDTKFSPRLAKLVNEARIRWTMGDKLVGNKPKGKQQ